MPIDHDDMTLTIPPDRYAEMQAKLRATMLGLDASGLLPMLGLVDQPNRCGTHERGKYCERLAGHEGKHRWER